MKEFKLRKTPVVKVKIDGKPYGFQANPTIIISVSELNKQYLHLMENADKLDDKKALEVMNAIADETREVVITALGEKACDELIGRHELDPYRVHDLLKILSEVYESDEMQATYQEMQAALQETK